MTDRQTDGQNDTDTHRERETQSDVEPVRYGVYYCYVLVS